jgi:hypothetical protein
MLMLCVGLRHGEQFCDGTSYFGRYAWIRDVEGTLVTHRRFTQVYVMPHVFRDSTHEFTTISHMSIACVDSQHGGCLGDSAIFVWNGIAIQDTMLPQPVLPSCIKAEPPIHQQCLNLTVPAAKNHRE